MVPGEDSIFEPNHLAQSRNFSFCFSGGPKSDPLNLPIDWFECHSRHCRTPLFRERGLSHAHRIGRPPEETDFVARGRFDGRLKRVASPHEFAARLRLCRGA
jgi:hypothetical protein